MKNVNINVKFTQFHNVIVWNNFSQRDKLLNSINTIFVVLFSFYFNLHIYYELFENILFLFWQGNIYLDWNISSIKIFVSIFSLYYLTYLNADDIFKTSLADRLTSLFISILTGDSTTMTLINDNHHK